MKAISIDRFSALEGSDVLVSGGEMGSLAAGVGSRVEITGGTKRYGFSASEDSVVTISGGTTRDFTALPVQTT